MFEFFEKNLGFFILVTIIGSFVVYSVKKEEKEKKKKAEKAEKEKQEKEAQSKTEESQKKGGKINGRASA